MTRLVVLTGCILGDKGGVLKLATLDGDILEISTTGVVKQAAMDTGKDPLVRVFVDPETEVKVSVKAKDLGGGSRVGGTIYKYLDDGGTISKSRDDGGGGGTPSKDFDDGGGGTPSKDFDDGMRAGA